jgi:hypothetical protein
MDLLRLELFNVWLPKAERPGPHQLWEAPRRDQSAALSTS